MNISVCVAILTYLSLLVALYQTLLSLSMLHAEKQEGLGAKITSPVKLKWTINNWESLGTRLLPHAISLGYTLFP